MNGKNVLITGANKGIGFETARQMARQGYRVWLGSRDEERGRAAASALSADGGDVRALPLDVTSDDSVAAAVAVLEGSDNKLDVLINNAGIAIGMDAPRVESLANIARIYETNVFGAIRVTQAFLSLLQAAGGSNVVMVSSGLGSLTWVSDPAHPYYQANPLGYNSSKSALNAVTVAFAKDLAGTGIRVNAADPGYTATDLNNHSGPRTVEQAASGIVWLATQDASGPNGGFFFDGERAPW